MTEGMEGLEGQKEEEDEGRKAADQTGKNEAVSVCQGSAYGLIRGLSLAPAADPPLTVTETRSPRIFSQSKSRSTRDTLGP